MNQPLNDASGTPLGDIEHIASEYGLDHLVEVPDDVGSGAGDISIQELVGGRYAVLTTDKDPSICGPDIGRFYQEYVPQKGLEIDDTRPTYEIYYERALEYCVPIV